MRKYSLLSFPFFLHKCFGQKRAALENPMYYHLTDDQGYADVGLNGSTEIPTPGIAPFRN